eukprot:scaffold1749_cov289-Prasinococcus_capsulatus_cf.AAC.4
MGQLARPCNSFCVGIHFVRGHASGVYRYTTAGCACDSRLPYAETSLALASLFTLGLSSPLEKENTTGSVYSFASSPLAVDVRASSPLAPLLPPPSCCTLSSAVAAPSSGSSTSRSSGMALIARSTGLSKKSTPALPLPLSNETIPDEPTPADPALLPGAAPPRPSPASTPCKFFMVASTGLLNTTAPALPLPPEKDTMPARPTSASSARSAPASAADEATTGTAPSSGSTAGWSSGKPVHSSSTS